MADQSFQDYALAARMRDAVRRIALDVLDRERPRYRYGIVASIDRANSKCTVYFDNDALHPVTVRMGSIQPSATGQVVRVAGLSGDRFVDDVMGAAYSGAATADTSWNVIGTAGQPAFQNAWANYGGAYSTAAFRKLSSGLVLLRGLIKSGNPAAGAAIFTLPAGYRPGALTGFGVAQNIAGSTTTVEMDIDAAGNLKWYGSVNTAWVALDGTTFLAEG